MASAPIIIPILVLMVAIVAIILSLYHFMRKLCGCPHQKSSYPIDPKEFDSKRKSVLPANPYTIDPSSPSSNNSTASPNSVYFKGGILLLPTLAAASAPSRSPSPRDTDLDQRSSTRKTDSNDLETVDNRTGSFAPSPVSSNTTREDTQQLFTVHSTDSSSPEHLNNFNLADNRWNDNHFESDV